MRNLIHLFLLGILLHSSNCDNSNSVILDITKYDNSRKNAIDSSFDFRSSKIYRKKESDMFSGLVVIKKQSIKLIEMSIVKGDVTSVIEFTNDGKEYGRFTMKPEGIEYSSKDDTLKVTTVVKWKSLSNENILKGSVFQEAYNAKVNMQMDDRPVEIVTDYTRNDSLSVTESTQKNTEDGKITRKSIEYKKQTLDGQVVTISFVESTDWSGNFKLMYSETFAIRNTEGGVSISSSINEEGNIILSSEIENYNGKNCHESDMLLYNDKFLFPNYTYQLSNCAKDVFSVIHEVAKVNLSDIDLKERMLAKRNNNKYFSREESDLRYYQVIGFSDL